MLEFLSIGSHSSKCYPATKEKVQVSTFANLPPFTVQSAAVTVLQCYSTLQLLQLLQQLLQQCYSRVTDPSVRAWCPRGAVLQCCVTAHVTAALQCVTVSLM